MVFSCFSVHWNWVYRSSTFLNLLLLNKVLLLFFLYGWYDFRVFSGTSGLIIFLLPYNTILTSFDAGFAFLNACLYLVSIRPFFRNIKIWNVMVSILILKEEIVPASSICHFSRSISPEKCRCFCFHCWNRKPGIGFM